MKQAVAIGIGGEGDAVATNDAPEQSEVAVGIFLGAKDAGEDFAGSVINRGD